MSGGMKEKRKTSKNIESIRENQKCLYTILTFIKAREKMSKYVILSKLTDEGRKTIMERPERIKEVNQELEAKGADVVEQYAMLGQYDFITIVDAPSQADIYKTVTEVASRGSIETVTLPAMDIDELVTKMEE